MNPVPTHDGSSSRHIGFQTFRIKTFSYTLAVSNPGPNLDPNRNPNINTNPSP